MKTMGNLISVFGSVGIRRRGVIALTALILIAASGPFAKAVRAAFIGDLITVVASNEHGSARARWPMPLSHVPPHAKEKIPPHVVEMLEGRFVLEADDGTVIGSIEDVTVELDGDPVASISFTATAGSADTTFSLSSATVGFPTLTNPAASADAELTLTDIGEDGASVSVVSPPNSGLFKAIYNGSSVYKELLGDLTISGGGPATVTENPPGTTIAGSVDSIQAVWTFKLSAGDQVSGTGAFVVVPEPSTLLLACFAACGLLLKLR